MEELAGEILEGQRWGRNIGKVQGVLRRLEKIFGLHVDPEGPGPEVAADREEHRWRFAELPGNEAGNK